MSNVANILPEDVFSRSYCPQNIVLSFFRTPISIICYISMTLRRSFKDTNVLAVALRKSIVRGPFTD